MRIAQDEMLVDEFIDSVKVFLDEYSLVEDHALEKKMSGL